MIYKTFHNEKMLSYKTEKLMTQIYLETVIKTIYKQKKNLSKRKDWRNIHQHGWWAYEVSFLEF